VHRAEEIVNNSHKMMKDKEARRIAAMEAFRVVEKKTQKLNTKLAEAERAKKSVEATLDGVEKQAKTQRKQLRQAEAKLATAKDQMKALTKKLEEVEKAKD